MTPYHEAWEGIFWKALPQITIIIPGLTQYLPFSHSCTEELTAQYVSTARGIKPAVQY